MVEFISQVQIIDCGLNKLDSKRISLERTDVVEIFIYHNCGFRKHKVLLKMIIINNSNNDKKKFNSTIIAVNLNYNVVTIVQL